ncbi:hypothetical protein HG421_14025 [Xanthomonas campestris pv. badrii]|uniref:Uncharacterized protein n=1 Tax=Xanthomonas campestris pv. badrii TaxID=149696 RepID=A0A7Z2VC98_XANCA|nr:hypothetical protein [Xanthomonas campestris]MCC4606241.1 hypothetical protein [Xanthomonas campestris pv. parthenii]QJD68707.1 hypothetical protein HG421_14025 [Xanthomonas campestris pv. badrii]
MLSQLRCLLLIAVAFQAANPNQASAAEKSLDPANLIRGMGEKIPAGGKNISLSPLFKVYSFEKDGLKYVQINSLKDEVLTVIVVTPGAQQQLPLGSAAETPMVVVDDANAKPLGMVTASATCPCSSQVVYDDAYVRIVVVYGANGEYIQTITINKGRTPSPPAT